MGAVVGKAAASTTATAQVPVSVVDALDDEARATFGSRSAVIRRVLTEWAESRAAARQGQG